GLMGGNLWFMGRDLDSALLAAERAAQAAAGCPDVILPFPGGVAASGSKAGSRYKFAVASTYEAFCPTLRDKLGEKSRLPAEVASVMEIIINGKNLDAISRATQAAITAAVATPGLLVVSAGNYGGRLGKSLVYPPPRQKKEGEAPAEPCAFRPKRRRKLSGKIALPRIVSPRVDPLVVSHRLRRPASLAAGLGTGDSFFPPVNKQEVLNGHTLAGRVFLRFAGGRRPGGARPAGQSIS